MYPYFLGEVQGRGPHLPMATPELPVPVRRPVLPCTHMCTAMSNRGKTQMGLPLCGPCVSDSLGGVDPTEGKTISYEELFFFPLFKSKVIVT